MSEKRVDREAIRQAIIEEAEYWDKTDTADMMAQETEWFTFEWTERENRCKRCGAGMEHRQMDLHLAGGRVILRDVPLYVCRTPGCGNTQLPSVIGDLADRLEALVQETFSIRRTSSSEQSTPRHPGQSSWETLAVQQTPSPEPALVREDGPPYGEEEGEGG